MTVSRYSWLNTHTQSKAFLLEVFPPRKRACSEPRSQTTRLVGLHEHTRIFSKRVLYNTGHTASQVQVQHPQNVRNSSSSTQLSENESPELFGSGMIRDPINVVQLDRRQTHGISSKMSCPKLHTRHNSTSIIYDEKSPNIDLKTKAMFNWISFAIVPHNAWEKRTVLRVQSWSPLYPGHTRLKRLVGLTCCQPPRV